MKTINTPTIAQTLLGIAIFYLTFKRYRTKAVRLRAAINTQRRWQQQLEMQKALDAEHSRGEGVRVIDGKMKFYEPYTAASLRAAKSN